MKGKSYRLNSELLAIRNRSGYREAVRVPAGAIVTIVEELIESETLVEVHWKSELVLMFVEDIHSQTTPL